MTFYLISQTKFYVRKLNKTHLKILKTFDFVVFKKQTNNCKLKIPILKFT